jgi:glycosyltransferase involved in cell wall biosynthesis
MARVFIGMAVFNGQKTVAAAIDSLLKQSFFDFTLFISDDASNDTTPDICMEYARKDARIQYYRQEQNLGMLPNLKFVLDQANEELFTWVDADDLRDTDFLSACVNAIDSRNVDAACTAVDIIDSYDRSIRPLPELSELSGNPSVRQVATYILQPEVLGKNNLMYSVFRTSIAKKLWDIYPQRAEWGSDYHFSLALVSRFKLYVDPRLLLKKRIGGVSSADPTRNEDPEKATAIIITDPKNHMFPFGRFGTYYSGHVEALRGTRYVLLAKLLLLIRLPRAFLIHLRERDVRKLARKLLLRK